MSETGTPRGVVTDTDAVSTTYHEGPPAPSKVMEIAVAALGLLLMVVVLVLARDIELKREAGPGQIDARFWPTVLAWAGLVAAAWRLVVVLLRPADERPDLERVQRGGPRQLILTVLAVAAFIWLWNLREVVLLGYELRVFPFLTPVLLAGLVWLYGGRTWVSLLVFPVATTALAYLVFGTLLRIPL